MTEPIALGDRLGRLGVVLAAGAVTVSVATAGAWTSFGGDEPSEVGDTTEIQVTDIAHEAELAAGDIDADHDAHAAQGDGHHDRLAPYPERHADATSEEQAAAGQLLRDVRTHLVAYADVDAATADGYRKPRGKRGPITHYLNRELAQGGGDVLDPAHPTGLIYLTIANREPVLLGAFFVAQPGTPAPMPAGDLVVWHSHSLDCPEFFATPDNPCLDARRMLHVWTFDQLTVPGGRRGNGPERTVSLVDPFGVPLRTAVEKVDG